MSLTCYRFIYHTELQNFRARTTVQFFSLHRERKKKETWRFNFIFVSIKAGIPNKTNFRLSTRSKTRRSSLLLPLERLQKRERSWWILELNIKSKRKTLGRQKVVGCLPLFEKWESRTKEGQVPRTGVRKYHFSPSHCSGEIVACILLPHVARKRHQPSAKLVPAHSNGVRMRHHWSRYRSTQVIVPSSMDQGVATEGGIPGKKQCLVKKFQKIYWETVLLLGRSKRTVFALREQH